MRYLVIGLLFLCSAAHAQVVVVSPTSLNTNEDGQPVNYQVSLDTPPSPGETVTISPSSQDFTEGTTSSAITFNDGDWQTPKQITVTPGASGDGNDGDVLYQIQNSVSSTGGTGTYASATAPIVQVTNQNIEGITAIFIDPSSGSGLFIDEGASRTITVYTGITPSADVSVGVSVASAEVVLSTATVLLSSSNGYTNTFTITAVADGLADADQNFTVVTAGSTSSDLGYSTIDPVDIEGIAVNTDTPAVFATPSNDPLQTDELGATDTIDYVLSLEPNDTVNFTLTSSDPTEATVAPATLTFDSTNWDIPQTVTVTGADDDVADGGVSYNIESTGTSSGDPAWNGVSIPTVNGTNADNDAAGVTVTPSQNPLVTSESGTTASIAYVLTAEPAADVAFTLASSDTTEASLSAASMTFTAANWNVPQSLIVSGVDDGLADGAVSFVVEAGDTMSTDPTWAGLTVTDVSGSNADDESATIEFVVTQSPLQTTTAGGTASIQYVLSAQPAADVTFSLAVSDPSQATADPTMLTFTSADWDQIQTVVVTGLGDNPGGGTYSIVHANSVSADPNWNDLAIPQIDGVNVGPQPIPALGPTMMMLLVLLLGGLGLRTLRSAPEGTRPPR